MSKKRVTRDAYNHAEKHEVFSRYHNLIVGHLGVALSLKTMSLGGYALAGTRSNGLANVSHGYYPVSM